MDLATVWFALIALCWVLFFVLEGFDFGVGMLAPILGRGSDQRGAAVRTIGPVWDGNEVWLVAAIGVMFAAFPDWYAALLSGLYLPFVLILLALAVRGIALEFRGKKDDGGWRRRCDLALAGSSLAAAALFGAVFGAFAGGLPLGADGEVAASGGALARSLAGLGSPAALLGAVTGVLLAGLLGSTYLGLRTTGPVRDRARAVAPVLAAVLIVLAGVAALFGPLSIGGLALVIVALAGVAVLARAGREALAFAVTALVMAAVTVAILVADFPVLLASSLDPAWSVTLAGAAASPMALRTISIAGIVVLPGVIAYQAFAYWVFRKRVASEPVPT
ncbi:cytochrome d ubiquinol oxidase subunit II [Ruania zhangjianzhongii]|uniref:cytochrome d ubiquinol oxidase subunit II n=1 Tax=Ruania zhangjianzhongii TaxID=2603206 RepID=UPI0011CB77F2|nr:cytochrome d ubiquinol oxidase subunit II [Ruania zhangjianzhongii]